MEEEIKKLKKEIRNLSRELAQRNRAFSAMENNFNIKMNVFRALAAENEKHQRCLTLMMKNTEDFIIILDKDLNISYCSDLFLEKIDVKFINEIDGKDIFEVYKKLNNKELLKLLKENLYIVLNSNKTRRHDVLFDIDGNGEAHAFRITNTPMADEETGKSTGIIISWSDTTDIINAKNEA